MVLSEKTAGLVLGAILLAVGIGLLALGRSESDYESKLQARGKTVAGRVLSANTKVTRTARRGGSTTSTAYYLNVMYTVDAKLYTQEFQVSQDGYEDHPAGSNVPVLYDPLDPNTADLGAGLSTRSASIPFWIGVAFLAIGGLLVVYGIRAGRRNA